MSKKTIIGMIRIEKKDFSKMSKRNQLKSINHQLKKLRNDLFKELKNI